MRNMQCLIIRTDSNFGYANTRSSEQKRLNSARFPLAVVWDYRTRTGPLQFLY